AGAGVGAAGRRRRELAGARRRAGGDDALEAGAAVAGRGADAVGPDAARARADEPGAARGIRNARVAAAALVGEGAGLARRDAAGLDAGVAGRALRRRAAVAARDAEAVELAALDLGRHAVGAVVARVHVLA